MCDIIAPRFIIESVVSSLLSFGRLEFPDALIFTHTIKQILLIEPNCGGATEFTTKVRHVGPGFVLGRVGSRYVLRDLVLISMQVSKKSLPK